MTARDVTAPNATSGRLLVVDDQETIRFALREYFQAHGFSVDCAQATEDAEALLAQGSYALAIVDVRLGDVLEAEGLTIAAHIRARCSSTRLLVLTAQGSPVVEREARRLGVDAVLLKPQPLAGIAAVVHELLGRAA